MRKNRFYLDKDYQNNAQYQLTDEVHHQIRHVLRLKPKNEIILFNGRNQVAEASIDSIHKSSTTVQIRIISELNKESPAKIHLGQVIGKGPKWDFVIQKATELGVHAITPLYSEFGMVRYKSDKITQKIEHWQKIAIAACAQSERNQCPIVHSPTSLDTWLPTQKNSASTKLILAPDATQSIMQQPKSKDIILLIGPEGGFSQIEEALAKQIGFVTVHMGPRILRTETATIAALSLLQAHSGDFT